MQLQAVYILNKIEREGKESEMEDKETKRCTHRQEKLET